MVRTDIYDPDSEIDLGTVEDTTCTIVYWVLQTLTWLALAGAIVALIVFDKLIYFAIFGGCYLLYLVVECCSLHLNIFRIKIKRI